MTNLLVLPLWRGSSRAGSFRIKSTDEKSASVGPSWWACRGPYRKSNPDVLMVQTSKVRVGHDAANSLNSTRRWCILVQR
jgi:hypothetical protein